MATLLSNAKLGNTSVSTLFKAAASVQNTIQGNNDKIAAQNFDLSNKTADDFAAYASYLNGRIDSLGASTLASDASKRITLQNTLISSNRASVSSQIAAENIQIMAGNATLQDKYQAISSQYVRAVGIGDMALAQSLESQAYSVSQTIQYQAQQSANASATLAKAGASSTAAGEQATARNLGQLVTDLTREIQDPVTGGQKNLNAALKTWVNANKDAILTLNPNAGPALASALKAGAQPNLFGILQGVVEAQAQAHLLAAQAEMPYNPDTAQGYIDAAQNLLQGQKISAFGLDLTYQQITQAAANPSMVSYNSSTQKFQLNPQTGTQFVPEKGVQPTYAPSAPNLTTQQIAQLGALHLNVKLNTNGGASDGVQVTVSDQSPQWIKNVLQSGSQINVFNSPQGLQFAAPSVSGKGQATYTVVSDATGKHALAEESSNGTAILAGEYGFNANNLNPQSRGNGGSSFGLSNAEHNISNWFGPLANRIGNLFGGQASAQDLINGGEQTFQANAKAAAAMIPHNLAPLPNISVAPPAPTPQINTQPVPSLNSLITPNTPAPQRPTVNPQQPGGISLQGGSFQLQ